VFVHGKPSLTNDLAYYEHSSITAKKIFLTLALGVQQEQGVPTSPGELISFFL
jgi:hypothetical protein